MFVSITRLPLPHNTTAHYYTMTSLMEIHNCPGPFEKKRGNLKSVTAKIKERKADKWGQPYPPWSKCYMTVSKTTNSNAELAILYNKKVLFPGAGVTNSEDF